MQYGLAINASTPLETTVELAHVVERSPIHTLWISDFPSNRHYSIIATHLARITSKQIGLGLLSPFLHRPRQIVQSIETLVDYYGERFTLLLGVGDLKGLLEIGAIPSRKGLVRQFKYHAREIRKNLGEAGIRCPIYIGAQGSRMIQLGLDFDGLLLNYAEPEMVQWVLDKAGIQEEDNLGIFPVTQISERCKDDLPKDLRIAAAIVAKGAGKEVLAQGQLEEKVRKIVQLLDKKKYRELKEFDTTLRRFCLCVHIESFERYINALQDIGLQKIVFGPPITTSVKWTENLCNLLKSL